jgi:excisionase family DNA binding protein
MLTTNEVATLFRVNPKTITRWAEAGKIRATRKPGGRGLLYPEAHVLELLQATQAGQPLT